VAISVISGAITNLKEKAEGSRRKGFNTLGLLTIKSELGE
jgi:hypothetical protein